MFIKDLLVGTELSIAIYLDGVPDRCHGVNVRSYCFESYLVPRSFYFLVPEDAVDW